MELCVSLLQKFRHKPIINKKIVTNLLLIDQNLGLNILPLCKSVAALDAKYSLAQIIMVVAARKLTNKVNAVIRSGADRESKVAAMDAVLADV